MIYCQKCGTPAENAAQFCGSCGAPFKKQETRTVVFPDSQASGEKGEQELANTSLPEENPSDDTIHIFTPRNILIAIAIVIIIVIANSCSTNYNNAPERTLEGYCNALKGKVDVESAYSYLSSRESGKSPLSKTQLATRIKTLTSGNVDGVGDCSINIANTYGDIAHGTITYTYGNGKQTTKAYELFKPNQVGEPIWMIETKDWTPENAPAA